MHSRTNFGDLYEMIFRMEEDCHAMIDDLDRDHQVAQHNLKVSENRYKASLESGIPLSEEESQKLEMRREEVKRISKSLRLENLQMDMVFSIRQEVAAAYKRSKIEGDQMAINALIRIKEESKRILSSED